MSMHSSSVFLKEHHGMGSPPLTAVALWSGQLGSQPAAAAAGSLELSQFSASKEDEDQQGKGNTTHQFSLFSDYDLGDPKTTENGDKTPPQAASMEFRGPFELGFGQPLICAKYPYADQCYGVYSTYGTQITGRMMLPLSMSTEGGPIYVNAKQYNGIMRRRKKRAEAELQNKVLKLRKPYLHLSRHLHAMRRPRGNGGRFLNKKNPDDKKGSDEDKHHLPNPTGSQISEVLQYDNGNGVNCNRSNSPGSEVTSHIFSRAKSNLNPFHIHPPSFQGFQNVAKSGLGISMASGNYLKV